MQEFSKYKIPDAYELALRTKNDLELEIDEVALDFYRNSYPEHLHTLRIFNGGFIVKPEIWRF